MPKAIDPQNLLPVIRAFRKLMAQYDAARLMVDANFSAAGAEFETMAVRLREVTSKAADEVYLFLGALENHPAVVQQQRVILDRRAPKRDDAGEIIYDNAKPQSKATILRRKGCAKA